MTDLANSLEPPVPQDEIDAAAVETEQPGNEPEAQKPEAPKVEEPQKTVPLAALHEERQKRKELQQQLQREAQERERHNAVLQDRLNQLWQMQNPAPQYRDPKTDPDFLEAVAHNERLNAQQLQQLQQERQQEQWQRQAAQQEAQLVGWAQQEAAKFAVEAPDFGEAYEHVRKMRVGELSAMGLAPQEIAETVKRDELWVFQRAAQSGQNPAEFIYRMAQNTGWVSKPKEVKPAIPGEQKIDMVNNGQKAAKTLTAGAQAGRPTPEQIAAMSDDEFAEFKNGLSKQGKRVSDVL